MSLQTPISFPQYDCRGLEVSHINCGIGTYENMVLSLDCGACREIASRVEELVRTQPRITLNNLLFACGLFWFLLAVRAKFWRPTRHRINSPDPEKPGPSITSSRSRFKGPDRNPGNWTPVHFKRPAATPYPDWDVYKTRPIPYRPFKYGPYYITMGLRTMKWDEWIELDNQYLEYHAIKAMRIKRRGQSCCKVAPEAFDAAIELLEEL